MNGNFRFLAVALLAASLSQPFACRAGSEKGFAPLFDGRDLVGWHVDGGKLECWQGRDGILSCVAPGGGWLATDSQYSDFVLSLEWRISEGGNSGVGLRFPKDTHVSATGMEIQILDDNAEQHRNILPEQHTGSIYYQVAARQGAAKPLGRWNRYEITCRGPLVKVVLNGKEVVRADLDRYPEGKGGLTPLKDRPRFGYIGLQSHGTRVDFRNIRIKLLQTGGESIIKK
jgi:hypothetical protein